MFLPVTDDFDGDSKADPVLYFPEQRFWRIFCSGNTYRACEINFDWR